MSQHKYPDDDFGFDKDEYWGRRKQKLRGQKPGTDKQKSSEFRKLMRRQRDKQLRKLSKGGKR